MPWKPGQSGNPRGRPRGETLRDYLRAKLAEADPDQPDRSRFAAWAEALIQEAETGDRDRMELVKFLEGNRPPELVPEPDLESKPRIIIPRSKKSAG